MAKIQIVSKTHFHQSILFKILHGISGLILLSLTQQVYATASIVTRYAGIDSVTNTAYVYDESFVRLPDNPVIPNTSISLLPVNKVLWYLGGSVDVVRKNSDGSVDVVSDDPSYSEMVHHMTWGYSSPNQTRTYPCGIARPFSTGSELTNFHFPKGYGYKLDSGGLMPVSWHWVNPANKPLSEKIYVRFNIIMDDNPTAYKDTVVDWIDTVPCKATFSIPPGKSKKSSPKYPVQSNRRIVAIIPHIHDHAKMLKLVSSNGLIREFFPENQNIPVMHDDVGQGPTPLHSDKKHLPVDSLYSWTPGKYGPIVKANGFLQLISEYKNPHMRDIDEMAITVIFWEAVK